MLPLSIPLARHPFDRDADARERADIIEVSLADPSTMVIALRGGRILVERDAAGNPAGLRALPPESVVARGLPLYLGRTEEGSNGEQAAAVIALLLDDDAAENLAVDDDDWVALRSLASVIDDVSGSIAVEALALANWHRGNTHCPRCGSITEVQRAGWARFCPVDRLEIFPRTDPAVITLVTRADGAVLLGSNAMWSHGRYSLLAGFVEAGESLEHAVIREIREEAGIEVVDPIYRGSQPWPFPASIMLGFTARVADESAVAEPDGTEILALRWFSRDDIRSSMNDVVLPGRASIARALLEDWFGGPIEDGADRW